MSASMVPSWQRLPGQPVHRETSRSKAALTTVGVCRRGIKRIEDKIVRYLADGRGAVRYLARGAVGHLQLGGREDPVLHQLGDQPARPCTLDSGNKTTRSTRKPCQVLSLVRESRAVGQRDGEGEHL